jgi:hypothetical protein
VSGLLCPPDAPTLADAIVELACAPLLRERLARAGLQAARQRTWEQALARLGSGYTRMLGTTTGQRAPRAA